MGDLVKKDIRIDSERLKDIRDLMAKIGVKNESRFLRELIDIGYYVKKKQSDNSEEEVENWDSVYQDASKKMIECHHLIRQIFKSTYDAKLSKYNSSFSEIIENENETEEYVNNLLNPIEKTDYTDEEKQRLSVTEDHKLL